MLRAPLPMPMCTGVCGMYRSVPAGCAATWDRFDVGLRAALRGPVTALMCGDVCGDWGLRRSAPEGCVRALELGGCGVGGRERVVGLGCRGVSGNAAQLGVLSGCQPGGM